MTNTLSPSGRGLITFCLVGSSPSSPRPPTGVPERSHSVLLQYSVNGGISWLMLDEFYFPASTDTLFLHLPLPASAQTNATRFRLWQPYNGGEWTLGLLLSRIKSLAVFYFLVFVF